MSDLRLRLSRRMLSPVEFLYGVTRHWFLVLMLVVVCTAAAMAWVAGQLPVFECTATLVVTPRSGDVVPGARPPSPSAQGADADLAFIGEQLSLLTSDTVFAVIAKKICADPQDVEPEEVSVFKQAVAAVQDWVTSLVPGIVRGPQGSPLEVKIQNVQTRLRLRTYVLNERRSSIVKMGIFGGSRTRLTQELKWWIDAYRARIDDLTRETYKKLYSDRTEAWSREEKEAQEKVDQWKQKHGDVSATQLDYHKKNVITQQIYLEGLQRQLATGEPLSPFELAGALKPGAPQAGLDIEGHRLIDLIKKKDELELSKSTLLSKYLPGNDKVKQVEVEIKRVDQEIQAIQGRRGLVGDAKDTPEQRIAKAIEVFTKLQAESISKQARLELEVAELNDLMAELNRAKEKLKTIKTMMESRIEETESTKLVKITVQDQPTASVTPVNSNDSFKIGLGSIGGLMMGIFMSFGIELLSPRIRFKRDLQNELGIKVLAVLRK